MSFFNRSLPLAALAGVLALGGVVSTAGLANATPDSRDPGVCRQVTAELKRKAPATQPLEIVTRKGVRRFDVEIAANDATRELGLMCRRSMAPSHGMLFEFANSEQQTFWMHNTVLPLDIIYVGPNGRIVSISNGKAFDDSPLPSAGPANGVLEINAGLSRKLGIRAGDQIRHPFYGNR
jgi:uncharacterized membrane protein (UPF0127 family)